MGMLDGIRADRLINQVRCSPNLETSQALQTVEKLKAIGKDAVPNIIVQLRTASRDEASLLTELLRRLVNQSTLGCYFDGLTDNDARVVGGVIKALSAAHHVDPNKLLSLLDDPRVSKSAVLEILAAHKKNLGAEVLLRHAYKLEHNDQAALFRIIEEIADEALIPSLINRLDAQDADLRARVAQVLSRFRAPAVQSALHRLLEDDHKQVRLAALEGLSRMGAGVDVQQLCRLLKDSDLKIQGKAIEAIIKLRHPRTVHYLLEPLQDESEYARRGAVEVLNEICDVNTIKELLTVVKDSDWWVRSRAADALGKIGGPRVVESVIPLIKDEDEFVRRAAIEIINATKDQRTFDILLASLGDSDWWVRERSIDALAELGNKRAVPALIRTLNTAGQDEALRLVVIKALGKLGSTSAVSPLIEQLKSGTPNAWREAVLALSALCDEAHADVIATAIERTTADREPELRQLAQEVLERIKTAYAGSTRLAREEAVSPPTMEDRTPEVVVRATSDSIDPEKLIAGDVLGARYRFIQPIGKGAFGSVFLMEDLMIKEEIVLKFLNARVADDEDIIKRFVYELRFARKITHQNVIRIFDMISFGALSAISMEYFPSHTLSAEVRGQKPMALDRALAIAADVCAGIQAAHQASVVHRDLKPNNILINDASVVKVVDFGVAAAVRDTDTRLTKTGLVIGTPTYMAPEQVLGHDIDARTDVYSLGVVIYEMLTGRPPYVGTDSMAVMYQHVQGKPKPPCELNPLVPRELSVTVLKAMAVLPNQRFQSMNELGASLAPLRN